MCVCVRSNCYANIKQQQQKQQQRRLQMYSDTNLEIFTYSLYREQTKKQTNSNYNNFYLSNLKQKINQPN